MTDQSGLTRRDFLKRGAVVGGTLVWVTPVVQVVGLRPAFAQTVSPTCGDSYAVKLEVDEVAGTLFCIDIYDQTDPNGQGQCLDVDSQALPVPGGCGFVASMTLVHGKKWVIGLDSDCLFQVGEAYIKSGGKEGFCTGAGTWDSASSTVTFESTSQDISNVQFVFCKSAV